MKREQVEKIRVEHDIDNNVSVTPCPYLVVPSVGGVLCGECKYFARAGFAKDGIIEYVLCKFKNDRGV